MIHDWTDLNKLPFSLYCPVCGCDNHFIIEREVSRLRPTESPNFFRNTWQVVCLECGSLLLLNEYLKVEPNGDYEFDIIQEIHDSHFGEGKFAKKER